MGKKESSIFFESEEDHSSVEVMKKKRFSILKYTKNYGKKMKCKIHCRTDIEPPPAHSPPGGRKLRGILKNSVREQEISMSEEDEESDSGTMPMESRCLVGSVPRPAGAKPGRGGGVCLIIRKDMSATQYQQRDAAERISRRIAYNRCSY